MIEERIKKLNYSALAAAVLMACYGLPASAADTSADKTSKKKSEQEVERIQVRGFAASLKENLNNKRFAENVLDAINADDIGKFPDKNVGDALQRVPGVGVERRFGESDGVSIRGLDPSLSMTYLNNQAIMTAQWFEGFRPTRGFRSDMMAAELVAGLEVYKSPQADLNEGSIGGTVNIKTRRPLDLDTNTMRGTLEYQYSEKAARFDPAVSALYSWKNPEETFGLLATISRQERFTTYSAMENYMPTVLGAKDVEKSGATHGTWGAGHSIFQQQRERKAYNLSAQYRPTDKLDLVLNALKFDLSADNINSNYLTVPGRQAAIRNVTEKVQYPGGLAAIKHDVLLKDITGAAGNDYWFGPDSFYRNTKPTAQAVDLDINYDADDYDLHVQLGTTSADGDIKVYGYFGNINMANAASVGLTGNERLTLDMTGNKLGVSFTGFDPSNPASYPLVFRPTNTHIEDSVGENYIQADLDIPVENLGIFSSIKTGIKLKELSSDRHAYSFDMQAPQDKYKTLADLGFVNTKCGLYEQSGQKKDNTLTCLPVFDLPSVAAFSKAFAPWTKQRENLGDYYNILEDTTAVYAMGRFEGENYRGNVGVRYVAYELDSRANQNNQLGQWRKDVSFPNDYNELLPSINFAYDLSETLILRAAAAKVMSLPNYQDLRNTLSYNDTTYTGTAGNPFLEPWRANQVDLGLEWYFNEESLLAATVFRKDIASFLFSQTALEKIDGYSQDFRITRTRNGGKATVDGVEAQFQTKFGNGFGMTANLTLTSADLVDQNGVAGLNIPGNSKQMWNLTGYWENETYSARIMANHRGEFFNGFNLGSSNSTGDYTSIDLALSMEVNSHVTVNLQGLNLTKELYRANNSEQWGGIFQLINDNGTRWFISTSVKF